MTGESWRNPAFDDWPAAQVLVKHGWVTGINWERRDRSLYPDEVTK